MRLLISDYAGHPFQVQLSRELARRGHVVRHVSAGSFQTPKGRLATAADDPRHFSSVAVTTRAPFRKRSLIRRRRQEIEVGRLIAAEVTRFAPDIVISSNAPLDTQRMISRATRRAGAGFVFWLQDIYSEAIGRILTRRLGQFGRMAGRWYRRVEGRLLATADHVVAIAPDFVPAVHRLARIGTDRVTVIENWAPLDEIPTLPRDNEWATAHLPPAPLRVVYAGTLGFKHDPSLIAAIARALPVEVLVFSQGPAAAALEQTAVREGLGNLRRRDWLPFADVPAALAAADILLVILEHDAGVFSVPSKVLTYLGAGRPIVGAIPPDNLAAQLIERSGAGMTVAPGDTAALVEAVRALAADPARRAAAGRAGRAWAEEQFAIGPIADRFETLCGRIAGGAQS